ncbi:hypothetical protein BE221DRAFT_67900 [Ostreococcus tauri]|uniref:E3 ubiquitin protein ligase n=2 Tax=Ostreococcus tauri TaxID=70448 RepID=A0A1Y5INX4_OSTTA|nr:hypothetical protein BE221DRAFT_67900 [Ostreococcus tauri]
MRSRDERAATGRGERYERVVGVVTNEWNSARAAIEALCARVGVRESAKASTEDASDGAGHGDAFIARLLKSAGETLVGVDGGAGGKRKRGDDDDAVKETVEELEDGASTFDDEEREALVRSLRDKADETKARLAAVIDVIDGKFANDVDAEAKKRIDALEASRMKLKRDYDALSHAYLRDSGKVKELQGELDELEVQLAVTRRRLAIAKANGGDDTGETIEGLPKMATAEDARAAGAQIEAKAAAGDKGGADTPGRPGTPAGAQVSSTELTKLKGDVAELEAKVKHNEKTINDLTKEKTDMAIKLRALGDGQNFGRSRGEAAIKRLSSADARADELDARLTHVVKARDELEVRVRALSEKQDTSAAKEEQIKMLDIVQKENKVLKDENTRFKESYALFDQAKIDKAAAEARVKSLEQSATEKKTSKAADLEKEITALKEKLAAAEATAATANAALEEKQAEVMAFVEEIEAISGAYDEAQEQSNRLLGRIAKSEEAQNKAVSEKLVAQSAAKKFEDECERISETAAYYKRDLENAYARTQELEGQLAEATEAFTKMQQETSSNAEVTDRSKAQLSAMEKQIVDVRAKLNSSEQTVATLMQRSERELASLEAEKAARVKAESTAQALKKKCERLVREGGATDLQAEVDAYKHVLNCNVCQGERQKAVIITRCWHMFCEECVQKRIASRARKCPGCSLAFAESDVQRLYW